MATTKYDTILFDLDGTLTNPKLGLTKSLQYALSPFVKISELDELAKFIGPPMRVTFSEHFGLSKENVDIALSRARDYYSKKGMFECSAFHGIKEMLEALKAEKITLAVATSKPTVYAKPVLEHFNLLKYFDFISGAELDGVRDAKDEVIEYALKNLIITPSKKVIMVGDRMFDIIGAKKNNLDCIGVLYGFGSHKELKEAGAKIIVETVSELENILLEKISKSS
ncbi:MAG: HAD hydrolase-like protein [Firmicutes bacterium]|nr:HAD hydrolase-like protein [Bacillota bacterium]